MSWAQIHRLCHFDEGQFVVHLCLHKLLNPPQACRTEPPSQRPRGAALPCIRIDQCGGNRMLDGIQKQSATRKPRNAFSIYRLDQRGQPCVNHPAPVAEFNRTAHTLARGPQGSIGNAKEQTLLVTGSNPSFHTTREKSHFSRLERYTSHCGTLQAHFDEAGPQDHPENMLILDLHVRLSDRRKHIHHYSHSARDPPDYWMT